VKNLNQQQKWIGLGLIAFGVLFALNLWWLMPIVLITGLAIFIYTQQRKDGNIGRAVQGGLWLLGLAGIFLLRPFVPVPALFLLLAGVSMLLRGHEEKADNVIQQFWNGFRKRNSASAQSHATSVPITPNGPSDTPENPETVGAAHNDIPNTGPTTKL
jgi:hypothetical protein